MSAKKILETKEDWIELAKEQNPILSHESVTITKARPRIVKHKYYFLIDYISPFGENTHIIDMETKERIKGFTAWMEIMTGDKE